MPVDTIGYAHRCNLHTVAVTLLALVGHVTGVNNLRDYCGKLMAARAEDAPHWLPDLLDADRPLPAAEKRPLQQPHLYIDQLALVECLQNADMEFQRLAGGTPYALHQIDPGAHRHSWVDTSMASGSGAQRSRNSLDDITTATTAGATSYTGSNSSTMAGDLDNYNSSTNSSPLLPRRQAITVELNFDAMKRALAEPTEAAKRERRDRHAQIGRTFREATFEELMRRTEPKHELLQNRLNDLFTALAVERQIQTQSELKSGGSTGGVAQATVTGVMGAGAMAAVGGVGGKERPIYENSFPELFYY